MIDLQSLPANLKPYIATQHYDRYTSRDHSAWRYIMRQSKKFFQNHAHPVYLDGLVKTGVPIDRIPKVDEMDQKLSAFGWGAVCVKGFIPPAVFLEFQSRCLLPIAADMRTVEHLDYTPAPDIVHEAAGHAPIIADPLYASYLKKYAKLARKAIYSDQDVRLYEAIRALSDIKENPDSSKEEIAAAEASLTRAVDGFTYVSESAKITRMYWWTAEYGIMKVNDQFKIYGAGLLSSVSESQNCLTHAVKKIPISLACTEQAFNITEPQPQLFYAHDFHELIDLLMEMETHMAFVQGGMTGIDKALKANAVTTTVLNSGIQISSILAEKEECEGQICFLKWGSPVQLAFADSELEGHSTDYHSHGFSTPIGSWKISSKPENLDHVQLRELGLCEDQEFKLEFTSGFVVEGKIAGFTFEKNKLLLIAWEDCTVSKGEKKYFLPEWGTFDMAVGTEVISVFGGPADFAKYEAHNFGDVSTTPNRTSPFSENELHLFTMYEKLKGIRNSKDENFTDKLQNIFEQCLQQHSKEWLVYLEIEEILQQNKLQVSWHDQLKQQLNKMPLSEMERHLLNKGLEIAAVMD